MCKEIVKKWTILIFADGNNEMEGVMYKSLLACEKIGSNDDVNIVFQIGRLGKAEETDNWSGVRRYFVNEDGSTLIEDLGKSNMADPNNLYDFIKWGFENYKAERYMVVLSDHGGDFIGCFTDESLDEPYIMGIPEMIEAINAIKKNLGYEIDILILDMCYMNSIEVIYELGHDSEISVKYAIMYMDYAAFDGINYEKLVYFTEKYRSINDLNLFIENLIDSLDFDLMAFEINPNKLNTIKKLFADAASLYRLGEETKNPLDIINNITTSTDQSDFINNINNLLSSMIIHCKKNFSGLNISIKVTNKDIGELIVFYRKLAFAKHNYFTELLSSVPLHKQNRDISKINVSSINSSTPVTHHILTFKK